MHLASVTVLRQPSPLPVLPTTVPQVIDIRQPHPAPAPAVSPHPTSYPHGADRTASIAANNTARRAEPPSRAAPSRAAPSRRAESSRAEPSAAALPPRRAAPRRAGGNSGQVTMDRAAGRFGAGAGVVRPTEWRDWRRWKTCSPAEAGKGTGCGILIPAQTVTQVSGGEGTTSKLGVANVSRGPR